MGAESIAAWLAEHHFIVAAFVAGLVASLACGLGVLPLAVRRLNLEHKVGLGYAFAGGLMFAASVYNLLLPAFTLGSARTPEVAAVLKTLFGMGCGAAFLWAVEKGLTPERLRGRMLRHFRGRTETLVFLAMTFHSIPEGIAVGVGYASEARLAGVAGLGHYVAIAIGIHNIPEGLAVALPMRLNGASLLRCFVLAFLTSLPQPVAAVPAGLLVWVSEALRIPFLGFAAGAMMYLVLLELVPEALERHSRTITAWMFLAGFGIMALVQVGL